MKHSGRIATPDWKKQVDRTLWNYACSQWAVQYQEERIRELEWFWNRQQKYLVASNSKGKETTQEKWMIELETARKRREHLLQLQQRITALLDWLYPPESEERRFVDAYWLSTGTSAVSVRTERVVECLPFLAQNLQRRPLKGNRNFFLWRNRIYERLARSLGYLS